ncbi:MAG: hypothetical protein CSB55_01775 [Candidatus Cloacimonadota bacterium]|nr:MAG: hypothetical protein CSB55_01775 [Candidatus Cloacimonadota bacterium]
MSTVLTYNEGKAYLENGYFIIMFLIIGFLFLPQKTLSVNFRFNLFAEDFKLFSFVSSFLF